MANEKTYDPLIGHAIEVVDKTYGEAVSVHKKGKSLIKFGRNDDIGLTEEMVWLQGGIETLPTGNTIDSVKSTNAGDTQVVQIEGHTIDGSGNLTFVVQSATLNGTTTGVEATIHGYLATKV